MIFLTLFIEFFKIGLFAIGGGLATIPFLYELAAKYDWLTPSQLADIIAVAESTPGPIGINCATYAGYNAAGVPGAIAATLSLVLPSFIIIVIISKFLSKYNENTLVQRTFSVLRPAATGLIAASGWTVVNDAVFKLSSKTALFASTDIKAVILFAVLLIFTNIKKFKKLHPLVSIGIAAAVGITFKF
ncbi:MAG: chromate transporter [Clostridia bacterium]|nr:chromate transporter [Clostridia bacterium]